MIGQGKEVTHNSVNQATAPGSTGFANESHLLPQVIKKDTSLIDRSFEILSLLCITKKIICIQTTGHTWIELIPLFTDFPISSGSRCLFFSPSALLLFLSYFLLHTCPVPGCCNSFPLEMLSLSNLPEFFKNPYLCLPLSSPISAPSLRSRLLPFSRCDSPFLPLSGSPCGYASFQPLSSSAPYLFLCQHHETDHLRLRRKPLWRDSNPVKTQLGTLTQEAWTQTRPKPS